MLALLTAMLTLNDPAGDARGDGTYLLPGRPAVGEAALDLRSFSAGAAGAGTMRFTVSYGQLGNPWGSPLGYSASVTDIFVKTELGGQLRLADTGLRVRGAGGWQYHLRVTGFGAVLERALPGGGVQTLAAPQVEVVGTALQVTAEVPPGRHGYWVTSSVYSPLSAEGVLQPVTSGGEASLRTGRPSAPAAVDVLAPGGDRGAYQDGTLAPVGQTRDGATWLLLGLGLLGLLVTTVATALAWRRA